MLLIFLSSVCIGSILVAADIQCHADIEAWAPAYPDARTISLNYDLFRARGLGNTQWILETSDDEETVRQFYRDNVVDMMELERSRGLAGTDWRVEAIEETGGSRIILTSSCGI